MQTYFLMAFDRYYPAGGFNDCQGIYHNCLEAEWKARDIAPYFDYVEIFTVNDNLILQCVKSWTYGKEDKAVKV